MRFKTAERRCLVHGLKSLLKLARQEKRGTIPVSHKDEYWEIKIIRKKPKSSQKKDSDSRRKK